MVRSTAQDGLPGDHDVLASSAYSQLDRERYRAFAKRSFHLAKSVSKLQGSHPEELSERTPLRHALVIGLIINLLFY